MTKDINKSEFDEGTKLKLSIFRECFKEWYPVFLHNQYISKLIIYDMFAGSGKDTAGNMGSPIILLQEAIGNEKQYCSHIRQNNKSVILAFNEKEEYKRNELECNIKQEIAQCKTTCQFDTCVFDKACHYAHEDFSDLIQKENLLRILNNAKYAKFVLLDQYGFKQINDEVFLKLTNAPKTDFIFFIASSFIKRFATLPAVTKYFKQENISFKETNPKECHRVITNYFRTLIPADKEYYLHSFTIQKGSNYYGLIFGTNHTLGMEKFLRVCWRHDTLAGESNCNINNDFQKGELFYQSGASSKKQDISNDIRQRILTKEISNNKDGLKYALKCGCEPKVYVDVIEDLIKSKKVSISGQFNRTAMNIHNAKLYNIAVI